MSETHPNSLTITVESSAVNNPDETAQDDTHSHISNLTDDQTSLSSVSRIKNSLGTVLHQAKLILTGEPPIPEGDDDGDVFISPVNTEDKGETERGMDDTTTHNSVDFLKDPIKEMTFSRRIALFCMKRYAWYNPRLKLVKEVEESEEDSAPVETFVDHRGNSNRDDAYPFTYSRKENPSLEKAWAYFEHVALSRFIVQPKEQTKKNLCVRFMRKFMKGNKLLQRAEPGENHLRTKLYNPFFTPHKQLGDFGLGMGLYFSTLRAITVLTFLAGVLNTANFMYFSSYEYSQGQPNVHPSPLKGSAVCTDTSWVVCGDCNRSDFDDSRILEVDERTIFVPVDSNVATTPLYNMTFYLRNNCEGATIQQGMVNYATLIFIMLGTFALNQYLRRMAVAFDEDEQTAQDYSIVINNPPGDATNPEEWRKFFYDAFDGAEVTACTIAVDNDLLVRSLVERREKLRMIQMLVEPGTSMDTLTLAGIAAKQERERRMLGRWMALVAPGIPELYGRISVLTAKVQGLAQQDYPASNVFVTFETEAAQRRVLSALSFGSLDIMRQKKTAVKDPKHLFRGEHVLSVSEPEEPNTIRWQDLNEKFKERVKQQALTTLCTFAAIALIAFIVFILNGSPKKTLTAYVIAIFNTIFPMFAKALTSMEAHASESGKQRSLYFKIAVFRWVNTAIVITIITPFVVTLDSDRLIAQVYALFFADILTTNAIQLADPVGHLQRHILAPRAASQDAMNLNMQGQVFELAERYTNMTKILFLALWYCAIFPGALFLCSFALLINYFVDRISLMRTWKRAPHLGAEISEFSRRYFFSVAIVAMAVISSYYWASFPFDNLCATGESVSSELAGNWTFITGTGANNTNTTPVEVGPNAMAYKYCLQDFFHYPRSVSKFPFIAKNQLEGGEWMTDDQEVVTNIYGWSVVGVVSFVLLSFLWRALSSMKSIFKGSYQPNGDDQGINFSDVPSINSYVPQVESTVYSYPLLACNIDNIDTELLEWTDPDRPHSFYDLTRDAEVLLRGTDVSSKVVFSQVAHWPPEHKKKKRKKLTETSPKSVRTIERY